MDSLMMGGGFVYMEAIKYLDICSAIEKVVMRLEWPWATNCTFICN